MRFIHELRTPRVLFGAGRVDDLATEVAALGSRRALVVAGNHDATTRAAAERQLGDLVVGVFDRTREHVPREVVETVEEIATQLGADVVVSVGGGSTVGTAKAVALSTGLPILAVPTTFAGSEMTPIWGITDGEVKTTGRDARALPRTVIYDPDLTASMPSSLVATSGLNALAHAVEAVYAGDVSPIVRSLALRAVRSLATGLPARTLDAADGDGRDRCLEGAWLAGVALGNATMGLHHKLCHAIGGQQRLSHGGLHSVLLPYVVAYNQDVAVDSMRDIAEMMGARTASEGVWDLAGQLGTPRGLVDLGFDPSGIEFAVEAVMMNPPANPRAVDPRSVRNLLNAAHRGERPRPQMWFEY